LFYRRFFFGSFLRLVFASFRNWLWLIELAVLREGPFSDDFERFPRSAASAAPAPFVVFRFCRHTQRIRFSTANRTRL
jgi:hypothetical protein